MIKVLLLTNHPVEDASCRQRVYQYRPFLEEHGVECIVRPFTPPQLFRILHARGQYSRKLLYFCLAFLGRLSDLFRAFDVDVVFVHREAFPFGPPVFEKLFSKINQKFILSFDDALYTHYPYSSAMVNPFLYRAKYGRSFSEIVSLSSHVIAGNRILADYAKAHNSRVTVIPTAVDTQRYRVRDEPKNNDSITVGWIGSDSTVVHLAQVQGALDLLAEKYRGHFNVKIIGPQNFRMDRPYISLKRWSLESEVADLQSFDIGIMPLDDNEWTRGKCAFKALQYMAVAVPPVCSPVGVVNDVITNGVTGFLAKGERDWVAKLSLLIENLELRKMMGLAGREVVEKTYSLKATSPLLLRVIMDVACRSMQK